MRGECSLVAPGSAWAGLAPRERVLKLSASQASLVLNHCLVESRPHRLAPQWVPCNVLDNPSRTALSQLKFRTRVERLPHESALNPPRRPEPVRAQVHDGSVLSQDEDELREDPAMFSAGGGDCSACSWRCRGSGMSHFERGHLSISGNRAAPPGAPRESPPVPPIAARWRR